MEKRGEIAQSRKDRYSQTPDFAFGNVSRRPRTTPGILPGGGCPVSR